MEMYSNVTEMDATIESDTGQNTNSLISSGYFIENYSEDDSVKRKITRQTTQTPYWNLLKTTLAQQTDGLTLVPFSPRTNSLPFIVPLTTKISFLSIAFFFFFIVKQFVPL